MSSKSIDLKIVVLGPAAVGKTCVIHRFCNGAFLTQTLPTIGAGFFPHTMRIDGTEINMMLWDTAGEERFRSVAPSLLRGANGLVLVFDCTNAETFRESEIYLNMFLDTADYDTSMPLPVLLFGNKCDLEDKVVSEEMMAGFCKQRNIQHWAYVSAKTGEGIEKAMEEYIHDFLNHVRVPDTIPLQLEAQQKPAKKECC